LIGIGIRNNEEESGLQENMQLRIQFNEDEHRL